MKCVVINKFHSVFVDQSGQVFTCGHGHGGRLGHNSEHSVITPTKLKSLKDEVCVQAAIGIDHTILLMETGSVSTDKLGFVSVILFIYHDLTAGMELRHESVQPTGTQPTTSSITSSQMYRPV